MPNMFTYITLSLTILCSKLSFDVQVEKTEAYRGYGDLPTVPEIINRAGFEARSAWF